MWRPRCLVGPAAVLLGLGGGTCAAAEVLWQQQAIAAGALAPTEHVAAADGGFWVLGTISETPAVVRYGADGKPRFSRRIGGGGIGSRLATSAGGAVLLATFETETGEQPRCTVRRVESDGTMRWKTRTDGYGCRDLLVDGDASWLLTGAPFERDIDRVFRVAPDGVAREYTGWRGALHRPSAAGVGSGGDLLLLGSDSEAASVLALTPNDDDAWQYTSLLENSSFEDVARLVDGSLLAVGGVGPGGGSDGGSGLVVLLSAAGAQLASRVLDIEPVFGVRVESVGTGAVAVFDQGAPTTLVRFASDGSTLWQRSLPGFTCADDQDPCPLAVTPDGEILVHGERAGAEVLLRFDSDGLEIARSSLLDTELVVLTALADGTALATTRPLTSGPTIRPLRRFGIDGGELAPPRVDAVAATGGVLITGEIDADGRSVLLARDRASGTLAITRLEPTGSERWSATVEGDWSDLFQPSLAVAVARACSYGRTLDATGQVEPVRADCFDLATGQLRWRVPLSRQPAAMPLCARVLDSGTFIAILGEQFNATRVRRVVVDAAGVIAASDELGTFASPSCAIDEAGTVHVGNADDGVASAVGIALGGSTAYAAQWSADEFRPTSVASVAGRRPLFFGAGPTAPGGLSARQLDAAGALVWQTELSDRDDTGSVLPYGDSLYLTLRQSLFVGGFPRAPIASSVVRLNAATGAVVWLRQPHFDIDSPFRVAIDESANELHLVAARSTHLTRQVLALADGSTLRAASEACAAAACSVAAFRLLPGAGGLALVAARALEPARFARLYAVGDGDAVTGVRADQPGVGGAWYAPYGNGQGFVVDWVASTRTLFAPWFTFSHDANNDPSELRWYALQATVAPGATRAALTIFENRNGVFAEPPTTAAANVGSAELTFESCDRAVLRYDFVDAVNEGVDGVIALQRLTPTTEPCASTAGANGATKGLPADVDGTWYDPTTSGQGVMFAVARETASHGQLFGTWFTYDPAGASDDPGSQAWFTLQGPIADGSSVETSINRTLGGSFDAEPTGSTLPVGSARVTFVACDRARLDYRFVDTEVAVPFRGRQGSIDLERIGGCAP